jgi:hypothetical protein
MAPDVNNLDVSINQQETATKRRVALPNFRLARVLAPDDNARRVREFCSSGEFRNHCGALGASCGCQERGAGRCCRLRNRFGLRRKIKLRSDPAALLLLLWLAGTLDATAAPFRLVSARDSSQDAPAGGSGDSFAPILTADGRYVLFTSTANNLTVTSVSNNPPSLSLPAHLNVFVRDRTNRTTTLASINLNGAGANGNSFPAAISTDGRYALFESTASDLVPGDTNGVSDIFVRDLVAGTTALVSVSTNGGCGDGASPSATMSPDGRFVVFVSLADNLVPGDTNGIADVFLRDLQAGTTTLVSVGASASGAVLLQSGSAAPEISADGRYVAFYSTATNLVPGVGVSGEIYVRDVVGASTTWASVNARALASTLVGSSNVVSYNPALSADGKFVAFETGTNPASVSYSKGLVLRYSLGAGLTDIVSTNAAVTYAAAAQDIHNLDMSPDGRFIAYTANNGTSNFRVTTSIVLWDGQTGLNRLVSANTNGTVSLTAICEWPSMDASGRYVTFLSNATNLVTNSLSGQYEFHVYLRDLQAGLTSLLDEDTYAVGASVAPSTVPQVNASGGVVAFEAPDASMVANDRNHDSDIFLRDIAVGSVELISAHEPTLVSSSANGSSGTTTLSVSADGRFVAFASDADDLVPNDANGVSDTFVRDLFTGQTVLASVGANAPSSEPAMSGNGRFVVFSSVADNLTLNDTNRAQDVFLRDLQSGATILVSVSKNGNAPGNHASYAPVISFDGRYVHFLSKADNLVTGVHAGTTNLFLRDMQSGVTYALTTIGVLATAITSDGRYVAFNPNLDANIYLWDTQVGGCVLTNNAGMVSAIGISPEGKRIAFVTSSNLWAVDRASASTWLITNQVATAPQTGLRLSADGRVVVYTGSAGYANTQIFVYDFGPRTSTLISRSFDGSGAGNGNADSPDVSADGRFVVYRSVATNIVAMVDALGLPKLFLYDRWLDMTTLLTRDRFTGLPSDNRSLNPSFSADGRVLAFQTWASDVVPLDSNHGSDVLALSFLYVNIMPSSSPLQGPTLSWPARPGESYRVQTNGALNSGVWQDAGGNITITGNQAQLTDPAPASGSKFYRIIAF